MLKPNTDRSLLSTCLPATAILFVFDSLSVFASLVACLTLLVDHVYKLLRTTVYYRIISRANSASCLAGKLPTPRCRHRLADPAAFISISRKR